MMAITTSNSMSVKPRLGRVATANGARVGNLTLREEPPVGMGTGVE